MSGRYGFGRGYGRRRRAGGAAAFNPSVTLFGGGEQGYYLDPSDFSTMFQDSAGTVPVTATGQIVRRILDKSGRGNHFVQPTADINAPTLQIDGNGKYFLLFDGVNDWLESVATITPGADKMQIFAGIRKLADAALSIALEASANGFSNAGAFFVCAPESTGASGNYSFYARGSAAVGASITSGTFVAPETAVITMTADIAGDSRVMRRNGTQVANSAADMGTGNFLAYTHYIGRRGGTTLPASMRLYPLINRYGAVLPADTITATETFVNGQTGAY